MPVQFGKISRGTLRDNQWASPLALHNQQPDTSGNEVPSHLLFHALDKTWAHFVRGLLEKDFVRDGESGVEFSEGKEFRVVKGDNLSIVDLAGGKCFFSTTLKNVSEMEDRFGSHLYLMLHSIDWINSQIRSVVLMSDNIVALFRHPNLPVGAYFPYSNAKSENSLNEELVPVVFGGIGSYGRYSENILFHPL